MAIDTRNKRASVLGLGLVAQLVLPAPGTGLAAVAARQQVAGCYVLDAVPAVDLPDGTTTFAWDVADRTFSWEGP